jgi:transposase
MSSGGDHRAEIDELRRQLSAKDALLAARTAELAAAKTGLIAKTLEAEKLKAQLAKLRREKFGASSERIERAIEQFELALEGGRGSRGADRRANRGDERGRSAGRSTSSRWLDRGRQEEAPPAAAWAAAPRYRACARRRVQSLRRHRAAPGWRERDRGAGVYPWPLRGHSPRSPGGLVPQMRGVRAPMPDLPIPRGLAGASLLAHVATSKFCDHLPLYRQAEIYARSGVDVDRGQLAEWLGHVAWLLKPLGELIARHVMAGRVIHADDTPVPVLAPGAGRTKTGRQWVYLRDERPHGGTAPPAVLYRYTPDRKGEHCRAELASFTGWLHADGYAGFGKLYEVAGASSSSPLPLAGPPRVAEVACWAHVRRGFFDEAKGSGSPIGKEALERIGALFDIERQIAGAAPEQRRHVRQRLAKPRLDELATWLDAQLQRIPGKSDLAGAIRYARARWPALVAYADHGQLEIGNNAAENAIRPVALGRKNWLFAGSDSGGERAALFYTLIRTAMLNELEPEAYLRQVITRVGTHPVNRLHDLLPWNVGTASPSDPPTVKSTMP